MKVEIKKFGTVYEFQLHSVAQLCGQNIQKKNYIFESIKKYFSSYKYSEEKNPWRDNVWMDGELLGRKYFQVITIENKKDLISYINLSKQGFMHLYIKHLLQGFECKVELELIENSLEKIVYELNQNISCLGDIKLEFKEADIWEIVQKTELVSGAEQDIEALENIDLMESFLNLVEKLLRIAPSNYLFLFPNIDHILSAKEYKKVYTRMVALSHEFNIKCICATSLDGYIVMSKENMEEIAIFNEEDFQMPDLEHIKKFMEDYFPIYKEFKEEELINRLEKIIQRIGKREYLVETEENVMMKLLNRSLMMNESMDIQYNKLLDAFLRS